jgi:putative transcriptional regulator
MVEVRSRERVTFFSSRILYYQGMRDSIENTVCEYRQGRGLTQEALGQAVGVTRQTVIAIERGNYAPSVALALRIAAYFGVSVESLFSITITR